MGEGAVAGTVNGDSIPLSEFNHAYNRQLEFFKSMMGGAKISEEQIKQFHLKEQVMQELVRRRVMLQEAQKQGYLPSDEEVRARIGEMQAFQTNGKFDMNQYKRVLEANSYTPSSFEKMLRDDLAVEKWQDYFRARVNVSEMEIQQQFLLSGDKRNIKYVLLTNEAGKRDVPIDSAEVQKFLADPVKINLVKNQYEGRKENQYKGKSFDSVKAEIAHDLIALTQIDKIKKANEAIAQRVAAVMTANKGSDAAVNKILKPYGVEVKLTGFINREAQHVPGIGDAHELMADAFAPKSPIDPAQGGKVKAYPSNSWILLAVVTESQKPDSSKLTADHDTLAKQIIARKERTLFESWLMETTKKAKIDINPSVMGDKET